MLSDTLSGSIRMRQIAGMPPGASTDVELVQDAAACEAATAGVERATFARRRLDSFVVVKMAPPGAVFYLLVERGVPIGVRYVLNERFELLLAIG